MEFLNWSPLWWLALLPLLIAGLVFSLVDRPRGLKLASWSCRVLAILCLIFALCRPFWSSDGKGEHYAFLLDVSESVALDGMKKGLAEVEEQLNQLPSKATSQLYLLGKTARPTTVEEARTFLAECEAGRGEADFRAASDLQSALRKIRLDLPGDKSQRIIVLTDGLLSTDYADLHATLAGEGTGLRVVNLPSLQKPEASVVSFSATSPTSFQGERNRLKVTARANTEMKARLQILHRGVVVAEKAISLPAGEDVQETIDVEMVTSGESVWQATLVPEKDHFPANNHASLTVSVSGQPRVLVLHRKPKDMREAARSLREQGIELELRSERGLPDGLRKLLAFDAIMLADVPATELEPRQMKQLKSYVEDFGGGLIMTGSENSFGLGGYYKTPVEDVLPLVSRFEKEKQKPSLAMILVIDKSGSMSGEPIAMARQAAKAAAELLSPQDQIAVIAFDGSPQLILDLTSAANQATILGAIDSIAASGGTNLAPAMEQARQLLAGASARIKHVIAMTDGQTPEANLLALCEEMAARSMTVSTVALGQGAARDLLSQMAETGRGRYYETTDPANVPQIFTKETMQASKSAIKEDLFAVAAVNEHPMLIGYEESELPMILGYVMTRMKPTAQLLLAAESGDPLLAAGRFGLGTGLAWTADLTDRWGSEWLTWENFGTFWAQIVRGVLKKDDAIGLGISQQVSDESWEIDLRRVDDLGHPVHGIDWQVAIFNEQGNSTEAAVHEVGLGRYQLRLPLEGNRMTVHLADPVHGKSKTLQWVRSYPEEYRLRSAYQESWRAAHTTQLLGNLEPVRLKASAQPLFGWLALIFLFAGLVLRRI